MFQSQAHKNEDMNQIKCKIVDFKDEFSLEITLLSMNYLNNINS